MNLGNLTSGVFMQCFQKGLSGTYAGKPFLLFLYMLDCKIK